MAGDIMMDFAMHTMKYLQMISHRKLDIPDLNKSYPLGFSGCLTDNQHVVIPAIKRGKIGKVYETYILYKSIRKKS